MHGILSSDLAVNALLAGLAASVACGIVGSYVTVRKVTYIAGAIAHCTLGGMGLAYYLKKVHGVSWLTPLMGALFAALLAALLVGVVTIYWSRRTDTVLSAVWSVGMAVGILFIHKTPGYTSDLMSYLFGDITMITRARGPFSIAQIFRDDLYLILLLDLVVLGFSVLFYNKLLAVCFDEEYASLSGVRVRLYYMLLMILTALTVVLLTQVVGIVMVIALLALPAAAAGVFSRRLWHMMLLACLLCALSTAGGQIIAYDPGLPPGPIIILLSAALYAVALTIRKTWMTLRSSSGEEQATASRGSK
jgi:zinc transport system permease protein